MTITVTFNPPLPSDDPATFNTKAFATLGDLNTWSTQANALKNDVNQDEAALDAAVLSASTSASTATTQAGIATTQAGIATTQANNALNSANSAAASLDAFDDRYLGSKASDPTVDNDGNVLMTGALYWNSSGNVMRVYTGSIWTDVAQGVSTPFQTFSGTGAQTAFTLSGTPGSLGSLEVFISGVRQTPTTNYTVSGTTLTFVVAPPSGTNNIFVRWISTQPLVNGALTGDLSFTGTALRIRGDFSNATVANRVMFQTSTVNSQTIVGVIPSGTIASGAGASQVRLDDATTVSTGNGSFGQLQLVQDTDFRLNSNRIGTGTFLPMTFYTSGTEKLRIAADTTGTYTFGGTAPRITGDFSNATIANRVMFQSSTTNGNTIIGAIPNGSSTTSGVSLSNGTDPANTSWFDLRMFATEASLRSSLTGTGTFLPMTFYTGGAERMRIDTSGNVTMRATGSTATTHSFLYNENGGEIQLHNNAGTAGTLIDLSSGSSRFLHALSTGDSLYGIGAGNTTGSIVFHGASFIERLRIDANGNVLVTNNTGGLGYGTGAGGTVTQGATSGKATAVTLNRPCGQITMNNAALGAGAVVGFNVSNSLIGTSDVLLINVTNGNGVNVLNYRAEAHILAAGTGYIKITNISGGSLSEAVVINFAIIKGATA